MKPTSPKPPAYFSQKAKKLWNDLVNEFAFEVDALETLRIALENMDLGDKARELLRTDGLILADGKRNPATDVLKLCDGLYLRCMRALNLDIVQAGTPAGKRV